jgi:hypothetical protein
MTDPAGAGIYIYYMYINANMTGVDGWDPWHTIAYTDPMGLCIKFYMYIYIYIMLPPWDLRFQEREVYIYIYTNYVQYAVNQQTMV